jgi:hypothetical protein
LRMQRLVPRVAPRLLGPSLRAMASKRFVDWSFGHYLGIAHPDFVNAPASQLGAVTRAGLAAA